jgi:hypothetical protein
MSFKVYSIMWIKPTVSLSECFICFLAIGIFNIMPFNSWSAKVTLSCVATTT